MRVLSNTPSGKLILNPQNILQIVKDSPEKSAALVVRGKDIIVSTGYTCHNDMMDAAGIEMKNFDLSSNNVEEATFRGGINETGVSFDIWNLNDVVDVEGCTDVLQGAYDFLAAHRKLRHASQLQISIYDDDYVLTHTFDVDGLKGVQQSAPAM